MCPTQECEVRSYFRAVYVGARCSLLARRFSKAKGALVCGINILGEGTD